MIDFIEKNWRKQLILLLLFFFIPIMLSSRHTQKNISSPDDTLKNLTRWEFYEQLYITIQNDELLRSIYTPSKTKCDAAFLLPNSIYHSDNFSNELLNEIKEQTYSHINIEKYSYPLESMHDEIYWTLSKSSNPENYSDILNCIFFDYSTLTSHEKEIIDFLCQNGLLLYDNSSENEQYSLNISKIITKSEQNLINKYIKTKTIKIPPNSIKTKDKDGNSITLCFSDPFSLNITKNILQKLSSQNELLYSFVYFDNAGTTLSLWINSSSCGVFSIPLFIENDTFIEFPCFSDQNSILQRLNIIECFMPKCAVSEFEAFCEQIQKNNNTDNIFEYSLNNRRIKVHVNSHETSSAIRVSFKLEEVTK